MGRLRRIMRNFRLIDALPRAVVESGMARGQTLQGPGGWNIGGGEGFGRGEGMI